ncbi:MAG TPA: hypothetical protein VHD36_05330, partial [Pirellulales bacterium]|nr:hypothetical protein [Pirellulales bacterium]
RDMLVVTQNLDAHEEIQSLLAKLYVALPKQPEAEAQDRAAAGGPPVDESSEGAESRIVIYELRHLNPDDARQALTSLVMPESWQGQGGGGAAYGVTFLPDSHDPNAAERQRLRRLLAVRQTDDGHTEIRMLLRKLDKGPHFLGFSGGF